MRLPTVTVVVAARNEEDTIDACVRSLLDLRYPDGLREIVVVDNDSRDRTRSRLERYSDRIVLLHEGRRGPSAARNAGVRRAQGDVVAFTDADCTVDPDWLRELVEPLDDAAVGVVGGRILARDGANEAEQYGEIIHDHHASIHVWRPPYVISMNWASPRRVLEEAGGFDEGLRRVEDVDLSHRITRAGYSLVYRPEAVVYHRNERSLAGLFREGWQHGFHAVPVVTRHADYIAEVRMSPPESAPPAPPLPVVRARYARAFRAGKTLGRTCGGFSLALSNALRLPGTSRCLPRP